MHAYSYEFTVTVIYTGSYPLYGAAFGQGTGPIWLDNLVCNANVHTRLSDCPANAIGVHNCDHSEDAGVICLSKYSEYTLWELYVNTMLHPTQHLVSKEV